jgi:3-dehydroquinate synthase
MQQVMVTTQSRDYPILISKDLHREPGLLERLRPAVGGRRCLIVTDCTVEKLYARPWQKALTAAGAEQVATFAFSPGEPAKTLATFGQICEAAVGHGLDRSSVIIGLGGGVAGDLAGFAAAAYMRGIGFLQIPTSLLAMVDSSVGGKTGVDLAQGKNLVGAFYQPQMVWIDLACLTTLPHREFCCGLAEIVKYGISLDADFFQHLEACADSLVSSDLGEYDAVVKRCCELKAAVVGADERESSGLRAILNYGHTFGHALEVLCGYAGLNHGEAVAVGMGMAADLAVSLHLASSDVPARQDQLLQRLGLAVRLEHSGIRPDAVLEAMGRDKKNQGGRLRLVLPTGIGTARLFSDIEHAAVLDAVRRRCD